MHDLAEMYPASNRFGQQKCVECEQQLVLPGSFVGEFKALGDELGSTAAALGGYSLNSLKAGLQIVYSPAHVEGQAPGYVLGILRNGWCDHATAFRNGREQALEPMFEIILVLRARPLRINTPRGRFRARAEPALGRAFEVGLEELGADDHVRCLQIVHLT